MLNQDPHELEKFSALAHRWWDPTSEFRPLHEINPLRLSWIEKLSGGLTGKSAIDVGCGGGILSEAMARKGAQVTGIDLSDKALKVAELHALESQLPVSYEKISAEDKALKNPGQFDLVTCMEMLEHVPNPQSTIEACAALAKPGGLVVFSTLNRNPKSYLFAIIGAEYLLKLLPIGTHDWARFIKPSELQSMIRKTSLEPQELMGISYNPITQRYRLAQDVSVNYLQATQKC